MMAASRLASRRFSASADLMLDVKRSRRWISCGRRYSLPDRTAQRSNPHDRERQTERDTETQSETETETDRDSVCAVGGGPSAAARPAR
jgi:hypothetical protein